MTIDVDPALVERYILELARHGAYGDTGVWRLAYTPEWVAAQDEALREFVDFLNRTVGQGQWALVLTADHGSIPDPQVSGAFQISATPIANGINATFDTDGDDTRIVQLIQPTQIFIDMDELAQNGHTLDEVASYVMGLTKAETALPEIGRAHV